VLCIACVYCVRVLRAQSSGLDARIQLALKQSLEHEITAFRVQEHQFFQEAMGPLRDDFSRLRLIITDAVGPNARVAVNAAAGGSCTGRALSHAGACALSAAHSTDLVIWVCVCVCCPCLCRVLVVDRRRRCVGRSDRSVGVPPFRSQHFEPGIRPFARRLNTALTVWGAANRLVYLFRLTLQRSARAHPNS
jgi:hypothetical protein